MSFFGVPLSGLVAAQDQLQSISNNLANTDTVGYKDQNISFADIFAQGAGSNGAKDPLQTGLGVTADATVSDFTDGSPTSTGVSSNMALTGNGFFVVQQTNGTQAYSRAGDFSLNNEGFLTSPSGALALGYPAVKGVVNTSGALQPLQVGAGAVSPASATTTFSIPTNLSANTTIGAAPFNSPIQVFDSLGNSHQLSVQFTKTAANSWSYTINVPTADTGSGSTVVSSGSLTFNSSGQLTSPTGNVTGISIPTLTDGAAPMTLSWDLYDSAGNPTLTQTNLASATSTGTQNGQASGTLTGYSIGSDGTIEGTFSSGATTALGQVALASFVNTQGLAQIGNNQFQQTAGSGIAAIGIAGTGGRGTITGGSIESSNVNTATEFAKMIVAQQAYQADAKTVTTFNQVAQATIAMITG